MEMLRWGRLRGTDRLLEAQLPYVERAVEDLAPGALPAAARRLHAHHTLLRHCKRGEESRLSGIQYRCIDV